MVLTQGLSVTTFVVMTIAMVRSQAHHCAGSPLKTVVTRPNANVGIIGFYSFLSATNWVRERVTSMTTSTRTRTITLSSVRHDQNNNCNVWFVEKPIEKYAICSLSKIFLFSNFKMHVMKVLCSAMTYIQIYIPNCQYC